MDSATLDSPTVDVPGADVDPACLPSCGVRLSMTPVPPSCTFPIPCPAAQGDDWRGIYLYVDGVEIPRDQTHTDGWDYTDDSWLVVQLYGQSCADATSGSAQVAIGRRCLLR